MVLTKTFLSYEVQTTWWPPASHSSSSLRSTSQLGEEEEGEVALNPKKGCLLIILQRQDQFRMKLQISFEYHKLDGRVWWVWCLTWARMTEEAKMEAIQAVLKYSWNSNCRPARIILWNKDVRHSTCVSNLETSASSFNKPLLYSQLQLEQYYIF